MSEYNHDESSPARHGSNANLHNSLDDSANNSLIGKVKSRVSSILPNRLSKWFSPSAKLQNDSLNGSLCGAYNTVSTRRRRRINIEEEESYEDDEDAQRSAEYEESNNMYPQQVLNRGRNVDADENDDEDDSQNSDGEYNSTSRKQQTRSDLNVERQPPVKRARFNIEVRDSPIARQKHLLSSTPTVHSAYSRNATTITPVPRSTYQIYTHLNLYGNQSKKQPAFDFAQQKESTSITKVNTDIIDLVTNPIYEQEDKLNEFNNIYDYDGRAGIGSRKSLNIPSISTLSGPERVYATVAHLKRQPLSSADLSATNSMIAPARRTSTTLHEVEDQLLGSKKNTPCMDCMEKIDKILSDSNSNSCNGNIEVSNNLSTNKRQKLINGTGLNATIIPESNDEILVDSASESGESAMDGTKINTSSTQQRKTGLFNMSAGGSANNRNSSRTSSFGNGLNFFSHLEGRKSLFNGTHYNNSNLLNNSTLSLTSLNRRQFNASIYGSTSALSDSRLLNTFSPFYKGKTTYGGAAAYNKYTAGGDASAVRITPTLIRPTSSLSTLSSSNNSFANNVNSNIGENSTISSTAKRILDLINDFATPLSEAKKMASNLKTNSNLQIVPQAKGRLNDSDLNASRAIRLSQVRTPYSRQSAVLQPSGNASGRGTVCGLLPPIRELQVPTMSQLLQMKKMQNTTENARKIAQNSSENSVISEYTLPEVTNRERNNPNIGEQEKEQQKHTYKIRNKVTNSLRSSVASKDIQDEKPPLPVNLPDIAFPLMESVPKIDIQINKSITPDKASQECKSSILSTKESSKAASSNSTIRAFNLSVANSLTPTSVSPSGNKKTLPITQTISSKSLYCFSFSEPIQIAGVLPPDQSLTKNETDKYKFSPPLDVIMPTTSNCFRVQNSEPKQPQLKEGSCLDALSKPFALPPILSEPNPTKQVFSINPVNVSFDFDNKLKKSFNEWECEVCMIRNKSEMNKCIACQTPQKHGTFGLQFKKSSSEWECDTCMIRNKEEVTNCIACEAPRKRGMPHSQGFVDVPIIQNSFGDAFKSKPGDWECKTCMISNKSNINECIACQTKKPGHSNITAASKGAVPDLQFKSASASSCKTNCSADEVFKALAAQQKISKWECDACMTRNDGNSTKCACCDQPKSGITSEESTSGTSTKFQFGATAASKFSFGFGTGENASKESDLRKELSGKVEESSKDPSTQLGLGTSQAASELEGFQFGIKTLSSTSKECKKDDTDGNKQISKFKFGVAIPSEEPKVSETTVVPSLTGFEFGTRPFKPTTTMPSAAADNTPSVKFSLPSISTSPNKSNNVKGMTLPAFGFDVSSASPAKGGFSFGKNIKAKASVDVVEENKTSDNIAFKAPTIITPAKSSGFVFGSSTVNNSSTAVSTSFVSNIANTTVNTVTTTSTTTAAVKPIHKCINYTSTNILTTPSVNSPATPVFTSFSFGSNSTINAAATTTGDTAITSTSTVTTTANATTKTSSLSTSSITTTAPASTNIFGSFAGGATSSNASSSLIFGSSVNPPANNNLSTVSSSTNNAIASNTSKFGVFGPKMTSNVFGSFAGVEPVEAKNSSLVKPNETTKPTLSVFGNVAPSSTSQSSQSNSSGFVFGSNTADDKTVVATVSTAGSVTSTSTTWPKSSFVFGSTAATSSTNTVSPVNESESKDIAKPSVFGTFGSRATNSSNQQQNSSIFGVRVPASNISVALSASGTTSSRPTNSSTNLFGINSAPAAIGIFGVNSSGNTATPASTFGSSPFSGVVSSKSTTPTFGAASASGTTFGSFGGTPSNTTTNTTEVKKSEAAFSFGATSPQSTSGGFNFGSSVSAIKPTFNFSGTPATQQPTFNFTGSTESQSSTKPFQFGATPPAPVFNFNRGVLEGTPNAPFQFNAGAPPPVSSNIFAPAPTPGTQTAQQAKRKIRPPIRRVTQR